MGESREKNRGSDLDKVLEPVIIAEKLEIIDKALDELYKELKRIDKYYTDGQHNITQSIYNLEKTKELLNKKIYITNTEVQII